MTHKAATMQIITDGMKYNFSAIRPHTHTHTRAHTHVHTHTHTQFDKYCLILQQTETQ